MPIVTLLVALVLAFSFACGRSSPPFDPQDALESFQIENGFRIEAFAAEPDVVDPVAMDIDEDGRIWVVEDPGYPLDTESRAGRIKLLEDTDGDGLPNRATLFADQLKMPNGVMAWKKGVLVTDTPDVLYLEDSDGDGRADIRRVVLTGFARTNPQHTVSSPAYGLDNWIYLSHEGGIGTVVFVDKFGDQGGEIHYPDAPQGPSLKSERRSLRFRPDSFELEYLAGPSQYGQAFDTWGHLFTHDNTRHVRHEVVAARYLERNSALRVRQTAQDMYEPGFPADLYPVTVRPRFEILSGVGQMTSACGLTLYLGGKFPPGFENASFVAEPAHNLVHRDVWSQQGATFVARPALKGQEFLASTDSWFRPVFLYVGPDGALYLLDYYRQVIEHPEWTSAETYESGALYNGNDRGRIYRIVPDGGLPRLENIRLGNATDGELVQQLENPNIWWRRTAQRLLVDRQASAALPALNQMAVEGRSGEGRLHALWTLQGLGRLDAAFIEKALADTDPRVRKNALVLAEPQLEDNPGLVAKIVAMAADADPKVRFQLLCTLGYVNSKQARDIRDKLLFTDIEDPWAQVAALSWPSTQVFLLFSKATGPQGIIAAHSAERATFFRRLGSVVALSRDPALFRGVLGAVARRGDAGSVWWRAATLQGLGEGLGEERATAPGPREISALLELAQDDAPELRRAALAALEATEPEPGNAALRAAASRAAVVADQADAGPQVRADAINLVALAGPEEHEALLRDLIQVEQPEEVQAAAVRALGKIEGDAIASLLLEKWSTFTGVVREQAGDAMLRSDQRLGRLVEAMEEGKVQPWMLTSRQRGRLIMHKDSGLRERARALLTEPEQDRRKVVEKYQAALEKEGDAARGRQVFEKICAKCHTFHGLGHEVGPDLATVQGRPAQVLLDDILMPNRAIAQTYEAYVVETIDGRTLDGVMGPPSPTSVTLRRENGEEDVIRRDQIKTMRATNLSAMPGDLEEQISVGEMADLIRFLKTAE